MRWISGLVLACGLTAFAGVARSQPADPEPRRPPRDAPFLTLDRAADYVGLRVDSSLTWFAADYFSNEATGLRFDFHGQTVRPSGWGGYFAIPVSHFLIADDRNTGVSPLSPELGVLRVLRPSGWQVPLRLGVVLPSGNGHPFHRQSGFARAGDAFASMTDIGWVRASSSAIAPIGAGQLRVDAGVDVRYFEAEWYANDGYRSPYLLVRANAGYAADIGGVTVTGELAVLRVDYDDDGHWLASAAASVRRRWGRVELFGGVVLPAYGELVGELVTATLGVRIDFSSPGYRPRPRPARRATPPVGPIGR